MSDNFFGLEGSGVSADPPSMSESFIGFPQRQDQGQPSMRDIFCHRTQ
jgi:hypothetical protein